MRFQNHVFCVLSFFLLIFLPFAAAKAALTEDILIADFEGRTYGPGWIVEGEAFGPGPAQGTLPNQMHVSGFHGKGLVNSYFGGDGTTGKLTSPEFQIERPFISFLLGGGGHKGLAINLLIDGKIERTAAGPNVVPGGSEVLKWFDWNVDEFQGKNAVIEIVDSIGGSWGHINVDHIIQTAEKRAPIMKTRTLTPEKEFLHIPITMGAPVTWMRVEVDGKWQQEFFCPLTVSKNTADEPHFYATLQVGQWKGKKLTLIAETVPGNSQGLDMIRQDDKMSHADTAYHEKYRPQFHYTTRVGWINDPNGLVYYNGTWHLFNQHNPFGTNWGNMTWGHATSSDLIHWTDHPDAIHPDKLGTIFSGSGVIDTNNTTGVFQNTLQNKEKGDQTPIVLIFTYNGPSARFGEKASQAIAYSVDGGKTFTKYEKNPVIPNIIGANRDPKVIWYQPTKRWIMALYMDGNDYALFESPNLKEWQKLCDLKIPDCTECPDFFPLSVDADEYGQNGKETKWVFWGANGRYQIGSFDGKKFEAESETLMSIYGGNDYAAMTFSDVPDGRRIQLSWMRSDGIYPQMPFNQQYTVPRVLTLRTTPKGVRLFMYPAKEIEKIRNEKSEQGRQSVKENEKFLVPWNHELFDTEIVLAPESAKKVALEIVGQKIEYDVAEKTISLEGIKAPLELVDGKLKLRILVDRTSIELFAQDGEVQITKCFRANPDVQNRGFLFNAVGGGFTLEKATTWELRSIWK